MAQSTNSLLLAKLTELKRRIEFLHDSVDQAILVDRFEQELEMAEIEFHYGWSRHTGWKFWLQTGAVPKPASFPAYYQTKLEAIYSVLGKVTKDQHASTTLPTIFS